MKKFFLPLLMIVLSCKQEVAFDPLATVLDSDHDAIRNVMNNIDSHAVQIIYTKIDEDEHGNTIFTDYSFNLDASNYFYPASSVKLPVAVLALEFADKAEGISAQTNYSISGDTLVHSIGKDVQKIFAVSDNDAYNRLYELLGRDAINESLRSKGLKSVRIAHRLETDDAANPERDTLNFSFDFKFGGGTDAEIEVISANNTSRGSGYIRNDSLISEAMDFSKKNYFPLQTQHDLMKRIFFEENFSETERFDLSQKSKSLLIEAMHTVPRKAGYDELIYYDSYGKFFIFGNSRGRIQDHIKVYNKVGYAYGTLTDTALITDERKDVKFLLSATIYVNENGILNDDVYEYEQVGLPFLTEVGRGLYQYELERKSKTE